MLAEKSFRDIMGDRKIVFTAHAHHRMNQHRLNKAQVIKDMKESIIHPGKKDFKSARYKAVKDMYYFINGKHQYTVLRKGEKIALVITITNYLYYL